MSELREKCLSALADFLESSTCGWWFRVPMLLKKSNESTTIPSDQYLPSMAEPFGMSDETLVQGLVCLKFIVPRSDKCRINQDQWKAFKERYMLRDLFELEPANPLRGPRHYYVKMGRKCQQNALDCIRGVKEERLRIRRRICSDGKKRKVFVDTLLDLIASEWNDEEMEAWLTSDAKQVQQTNKKGDETDNSIRTASSAKAADNSTGTASPAKDDGNSTAITPNALSNSALKATLVPPNEFLRQGKPAEKEAFPFLHAFGVPIDNEDTLHGLFRDLQKRLRTTEHTTREQEVEDFTIGIRLVLLLLDSIYSLLLTKYGKVTGEIVKNLAELLDLLRVQWVKMQLPMTPKFHCLLRHAVS
jgi:hypothetical protein